MVAVDSVLWSNIMIEPLHGELIASEHPGSEWRWTGCSVRHHWTMWMIMMMMGHV